MQISLKQLQKETINLKYTVGEVSLAIGADYRGATATGFDAIKIYNFTANFI